MNEDEYVSKVMGFAVGSGQVSGTCDSIYGKWKYTLTCNDETLHKEHIGIADTLEGAAEKLTANIKQAYVNIESVSQKLVATIDDINAQ